MGENLSGRSTSSMVEAERIPSLVMLGATPCLAAKEEITFLLTVAC
jgi:hypothetical protein